jgi:P-type conjugative transfer protein TrbJ
LIIDKCTLRNQETTIMNTRTMKAIFSALALTALVLPPTSYSSGLLVIDGANLSQNVVTALENVSQTLKQIQQYKTQLQQYQNMLQNTQVPSMYVWDKAVITMNDLRASINTLQYYKTYLGSVSAYLGKFKDVSEYRSSPCFSAAGCSRLEWAKLQQSQDLASQSQKKSTDALFTAIDKQQDALVADAMQLQRLQAASQSATGQMQTLGYANQLASQHANQMLQVRALLVAQLNMLAARQQAIADREALESAAAENFRHGTFEPSPFRSW